LVGRPAPPTRMRRPCARTTSPCQATGVFCPMPLLTRGAPRDIGRAFREPREQGMRTRFIVRAVVVAVVATGVAVPAAAGAQSRGTDELYVPKINPAA
jgi:hypothetical protein